MNVESAIYSFTTTIEYDVYYLFLKVGNEDDLRKVLENNEDNPRNIS